MISLSGRLDGLFGERFTLAEMLPAGTRGLLLFSVLTIGTPADPRFFCLGRRERLSTSLMGPVHHLWAYTLRQAGLGGRGPEASALLECRSSSDILAVLAILIARLARLLLLPPVSGSPAPSQLADLDLVKVLAAGGKTLDYAPLN